MTTQDAFLGGRLTIAQPAHGFRAGVDAVLLAAACPAAPGHQVLELGCGVGTASLCLGARVPVQLTAVEIQSDYADLARQNAAQNGQDMDVHNADLGALPMDLRQRHFDQVIANPPYFNRGHGTHAQDPGRDIALGGDTPLSVWLSVAAKRLRPKGWLTVIQRMDRLPELVAQMPRVMGTITALPIAARTGREPHLIVLRARKEGRGAFRMAFPFIMHHGAGHMADADDYTPLTSQILRSGHALPFPD